MKYYRFLKPLLLFWVIPIPAHAQSPVSNLAVNTPYSDFSNCIVNEYQNGSNSVKSQAKCLGLIVEPSESFLSFINIKKGFSYGFYTTNQGEEFLINFYTNPQHQVKYFIMANKNFAFGGPADGECNEYLKDAQNHIVTCAAQIIKDELGDGVKNKYSYAAAINLNDRQTIPKNAGLSTDQAVCLASIIGAAIAGNTQAASSYCSSSRQTSPQPNVTNNNRPPAKNSYNSNRQYNPNREWLNNSMEDTDRFIGGSGWRDIERNPGGW
ncbi:MAG: hypothetical protein VKK07_06585 [Merismopediaceae bacterium]|nr:hypothetical protein [Merismopediaceae bacterium]